MPADPALVAETGAWLKRALEDIRAAEHGLTASPPLLEDVLFHCQQAAEKALKGFLVWHSHPFRKTHSLEEIGELCLAIDTTLTSLIDPLVPLTQYAWQYRYPGEPAEPSSEEVNESLALARRACQEVIRRLPEEVRSMLD